jgi:hypothetical protein
VLLGPAAGRDDGEDHVQAGHGLAAQGGADGGGREPPVAVSLHHPERGLARPYPVVPQALQESGDGVRRAGVRVQVDAGQVGDGRADRGIGPVVRSGPRPSPRAVPRGLAGSVACPLSGRTPARLPGRVPLVGRGGRGDARPRLGRRGVEGPLVGPERPEAGTYVGDGAFGEGDSVGLPHKMRPGRGPGGLVRFRIFSGIDTLTGLGLFTNVGSDVPWLIAIHGSKGPPNVRLAMTLVDPRVWA